MANFGTVVAVASVSVSMWVFFVQAPWLTRALGRDRFVPMQMTLMAPLLGLITSSSLVLLASARGHVQVALASGAVGASVVAIIVSRRALRAGGRSLREALSPAELRAAGRFLSDGGGSATRVWHRVLGLLLLTVVGTQAAWALAPVEHHEHASLNEAQPAAPTGQRHRATPETIEAVAAFRRAVQQARELQSPRGEEVGPPLQRDFAAIFERCRMTGAAHEALHAFLAPIAAELERLASARTQEDTLAELTKVAVLLDEWPTRFEP